MNRLLAVLAGLPPWAIEGLLSLIGCIVALIRAPDDAAREEALMEAAEAAKKALDAKKFGAPTP